MAHIEIWYRWLYFCEIRQKHLTTKYHCNEQQIKLEHPDAVPVESSRREQTVYDSREEAQQATCTSCLPRPGSHPKNT